MAASTRAKTAGYSQNEKMTSAQANIIDTNAAAGVKRTSTTQGTKTLPIVPTGQYALGSLKTLDGLTYMTYATAGTEEKYSFALIGLPIGHTLQAVYARIQPAAGHTAQPATLPAARLYAIGSGGTVTKLATGAVAWVNTATYHAINTIAVVPASVHVIQNNQRYEIQIQNESGSGAVGSTTLHAIWANVAIDTASGGADFTFWK